MDLYSENILDHFHHPRHYGTLKKPTVRVVQHNPLCGDTIRLDAIFDSEGVVEELAFQAEGCAISKASMSLLSECMEGFPLQDVLRMGAQDSIKLLGVPVSPGRVTCVTLGLCALQQAARLAFPNQKEKNGDTGV